MRRQADREKMEGRVLEGTSGLCSDDGFTPSPTQRWKFLLTLSGTFSAQDISGAQVRSCVRDIEVELAEMLTSANCWVRSLRSGPVSICPDLQLHSWRGGHETAPSSLFQSDLGLDCGKNWENRGKTKPFSPVDDEKGTAVPCSCPCLPAKSSTVGAESC